MLKVGRLLHDTSLQHHVICNFAHYHADILTSFFVFLSELQCDQHELVAACRKLNTCRNQLMHVKKDSGSLDNLKGSFDAGRRLLGFFPKNEATANLNMLEQQYEAHKAFKNRRMTALGWQFGPSAPDVVPEAPADPHEVLADGDRAIQSLQGILDDPLCRHAVPALSILSSAAEVCDRNIDQEIGLSHYAEAQRLQVRLLRLYFSFV